MFSRRFYHESSSTCQHTCHSDDVIGVLADHTAINGGQSGQSCTVVSQVG